MSVLTVKRELLATRCDICHQADCFTPETGVCTRCRDLVLSLQANQSGILEVPNETPDDDSFGFWDWGMFAPYILLFIGVLLVPVSDVSVLAALACLALFVSLMYALLGLSGVYNARRNRKPLRIPLLWTLLGGGLFWFLVVAAALVALLMALLMLLTGVF